MTKNNYFHHPISFNDINSQYLKAKRNIGICLCTDYKCYIIKGKNCINLLNHYSRMKISENSNSGYIALDTKYKFIAEALYFKASNTTYLIFSTSPNIYKFLSKLTKKYPLTVVNDASKEFSLFTFHGKKANVFFDNFNAKCLFKLSHQGYKYYHMITNKKDETRSLNYYLEQNFVPINVETKRIFLYNNKVITNFDNFNAHHKRDLLDIKYPTMNKLPNYSLELFECLDQSLIEKNTKILNYSRHNCGIVYNSFKMPNKKYPFILGIVNTFNTNVLLIKKAGKEILIRKIYKNYETL